MQNIIHDISPLITQSTSVPPTTCLLATVSQTICHSRHKHHKRNLGGIGYPTGGCETATLCPIPERVEVSCLPQAARYQWIRLDPGEIITVGFFGVYFHLKQSPQKVSTRLVASAVCVCVCVCVWRADTGSSVWNACHTSGRAGGRTEGAGSGGAGSSDPPINLVRSHFKDNGSMAKTAFTCNTRVYVTDVCLQVAETQTHGGVFICPHTHQLTVHPAIL